MQGFKPSGKDSGVGVDTSLALATIEETVDILLRHEPLLGLT